MRLALDPAVLAWALSKRGTAARASLLQHDALAPAEALARLREVMPQLPASTGLARGALWDLLSVLTARIEAVEEARYAEFLPLARRVVPPGCEATLALAMALEVEAVLAGGPGFEGQDLVPVVQVGVQPRQVGLSSDEPQTQ